MRFGGEEDHERRKLREIENRTNASSPLPFLDHGSAVKTLIAHQDNTDSYAGENCASTPFFGIPVSVPLDQARFLADSSWCIKFS